VIVDETNVKGEHVTRSVAQSHVLISTARGNMNNISSCLVKSTHVAFLVLIVNDHSLYRTRLLRVTWHPDEFFKLHHLYLQLRWRLQNLVIPPVSPAIHFGFFDLHPLYLPQQSLFQPMVIPPVPPATMLTHSDRLSRWMSAPLLRRFRLQRLFGCQRNSTVQRGWHIPSSV